MKVSISHSEKSKGFLPRKKLYGVTCKVEFNEEEKEVIEKRSLRNFLVVERDIPADVDADKFTNRGLGKKLMTAAVKGADANHWHLTVKKLMRGPDTYHFSNFPHAKAYEEELRESLTQLKQ